MAQQPDTPIATEVFGDGLLDWLRDRPAHHKCPRSISFEAELPRSDTGKIYKNVLVDRYSAVTAPG